MKNQISNWLHEYGDELYSWAFYKVSSKEEAEDLVQETFIAAFTSIDNFKENSSPKTWLFRILNNKIIDYYRKRANNLTFELESENIYNDSFDDNFNDNGHWKSSETQESHWLDNDEFNHIFGQCIEKLPKNWSFIIRSKFILDLETDKICQEFEITSSNYWQIIHRSKVLLKNCIDKNWNT